MSDQKLFFGPKFTGERFKEWLTISPTYYDLWHNSRAVETRK